jgi:hypothetical protein
MKKPSKLLFGAAGFSIAATALLMGTGTASATVCVTNCDGDGGPLPISKILADNKVPDAKIEFLVFKLETVLVTGP